MRAASHCGRIITLAVLGAALCLGGCGGEVAIRSNFAGPPAASPVPPTPAIPSAPKGFYVAGEGNVVLAVIVGMMIFDGVTWVSQRLRHAFTAPGDVPMAAEAPPLAAVRKPVQSWVFSRP